MLKFSIYYKYNSKAKISTQNTKVRTYYQYSKIILVKNSSTCPYVQSLAGKYR